MSNDSQYPKLLPGNILYAGPLLNGESKNYTSLGHFVLDKIKSFDERTLLIEAESGNEYTAKFLYDSIKQMVKVLQYLGVQQHDVVSLASENRVEFTIILFAAFVINATVAPLNVTYSERELHHGINLSKPKIIFASELTIDRVMKVAKSNSFAKDVVFIGSNAPSSSIPTFKDLMASKKIASYIDLVPFSVNKDEDISLIMCSSGTTGHAKGVQITQTNILSTLDRILQAPSVANNMISMTPWFHALGCLLLISRACLGTNLIFMAKFEQNLFLNTIQKYKVQSAGLVPPIMVFLAKHPLVDKYDLSSLKIIFYGAAPLGKEVEDQVKKRIGVNLLSQGYGMTESTIGLCGQNVKFCKAGSVGGLNVGMMAKVVDPDTGKVLGVNERGELCFKGECIMKGYVGDHKATQTTIRDGWLHTGDIGYYDEDFEFFIVDRIKELIKYKGFQVPPAEIEALLLTHSKIKDAAVIGKPDDEAGELPMAFVVKQVNGGDLTADEVIQFVAQQTSAAKRLRGGVVFLNEIPKNPSGKILRRVLRDSLLKRNISKL